MTLMPDEALLRQMRRDGMSQKDIAAELGVTRQSVANWLAKLNLPTRISRIPSVEPRSHKAALPWTIRGEDHHDLIARALRWHHAAEQGEDLSPAQQREVDRLTSFLTARDVVVDYDRDKGFILRPRNPDIDDPADIIRRPAE